MKEHFTLVRVFQDEPDKDSAVGAGTFYVVKASSCYLNFLVGLHGECNQGTTNEFSLPHEEWVVFLTYMQHCILVF